MVNKVILLGNVGNAPELNKTNNGKDVVKLRIATTEKYKKENGEKVEDTQWHNVTFYGKLAEIVAQYVQKGQQLFVEGKIRNYSYEKEGKTLYGSEIIASDMKMLSKGNGQTSEAKTETKAEAKPGKQQKPAAAKEPEHLKENLDSFANSDTDDDLPF